ncbi:hypothetical protein P691DRAFT_760210 [Macrolepiota fuliginosa MF-IS2]|uniref:Uncharacterized protein n=1 Tax=Macrolepiota fuliginosa MF-IS2 TaxID=1400762 RepID=A0A9P5XF34_9AGAR|nr:hypothetical protein P691DRAFT_760210 [Macrolepiota fuliginosa MF-IS2]
MVIANKADLVAAEPLSSSSPSEPSVESIEEAQARLKRLEEYVKTELGDDVVVVPVSAKYRMNLRKVVALMRNYVEDARAEKLMAQQEAEEAHDCLDYNMTLLGENAIHGPTVFGNTGTVVDPGIPVDQLDQNHAFQSLTQNFVSFSTPLVGPIPYKS